MRIPRPPQAWLFVVFVLLVIAAGSAPGVARATAPVPGTIDTFAGGGTLSGDDIPATSAALNFLYGIAVNSAGDVYFSDVTDCSVRKVSQGIITTAVGTGVCAGYPNTYSGDGGPATSAMLYRPAGLAFDGSGNLFIADSFNCSIRKVTASTGIISTVAGFGPNGCGGRNDDGVAATQAELANPIGVAVDGAGNLFIADTQNCRVREVTNGIITTLAGAPVGPGDCAFSGDGGPAAQASLLSPQGVAVDSSGDVYIADGCRIREISNGIINTVAGNGACTFTGDGPATTVSLNGPELLATDGSDNLFIADSGNCLVRKLSNGTLTTVAGLTGTLADAHYSVCGYSGDGGPATSAELGSPAGVAVDSVDNLYITDLPTFTGATGARVRIAYGIPTADDPDGNGDVDFANPGAGQPCVQDHAGDANGDGYSDADELTPSGASSCTGAFPSSGGLGLSGVSSTAIDAACPGRAPGSTGAKAAGADVDVNGRVNILDLAAAAGAYNQSGFASNPYDERNEFDQNGDGVINVLDLAAIAAQYNKTVPPC